MVVGSKGWAERRYIREVKDVQGTSDTSRILKDIQKAFSRSNTEGRTQCLQSQRRRFYASSACRGAIPVPTVATSEVLRFECLSRCYSSAYSRNVGGSTLRVPVEVQLQCLQSQRRRFYASSACRGAIPVPTVATSEVLRFKCLSRCNYSAYSRNVGGSTLRVPIEVLSQCLQSPRRRFYAQSACTCRGAIPVPTVATSEVLRFECLSRCYSTAPIFATSEVLRSELEVSHTTRFQGHGHIAPPSATSSSEPERRPNISTTPRKDCELIPSCWEGLGGFKRPSMMPGVCYKRTFNCIC